MLKIFKTNQPFTARANQPKHFNALLHQWLFAAILFFRFAMRPVFGTPFFLCLGFVLAQRTGRIGFLIAEILFCPSSAALDAGFAVIVIVARLTNAAFAALERTGSFIFAHLFNSLAFDILFDCGQRRTAYGNDKISRTPKVSAPKTILNPGKLLQQSPGSYALEALNQFRKLMRGLNSYNHVYVVNLILSCQKLNVMLSAKLFQYFSEPITYLSRD